MPQPTKEGTINEYTTRALELLKTRKHLPIRFKNELTDVGLKWCTGCYRCLPLEQFRISASSNSGRAGRCFECHPLKQEPATALIDFSVDPEEFTLARSLARLRRECRKSNLPVEVFSLEDLLSYWHNPPRSEVPAVELVNPDRGFLLNNIKPAQPDHEPTTQEEANTID